MFGIPRFTVRGALIQMCGLAVACCLPAWIARGAAEFEIRVVDEATGMPIAVRMHLRNSRGRAIHPPKLPFWKDHFVFGGQIVLKLAPGRYTFDIERGPEYPVRSGHFVIKRGATDNTQVSMRRFVDMKKEGWWSGDLHIHRPPKDIPLLMKAEDLHVAPVITWWNDRRQWPDDKPPHPALIRVGNDAFYYLLAGEDERGGGALLYFNLSAPLPLPSRKEREYPPMARFLEMARNLPRNSGGKYSRPGPKSTTDGLVTGGKKQLGVHVDIEKPFWWDVPVWVAMGLADSIGLANNHMLRDGMLDTEAWGKPRDKTLYPAPRGNGRWSQDIYYHLLNCGLHIPPSAGSASGVLANPVGYNRVYVQCGKQLDYDAWWEGLRAGRVVVTNGPLLRPKVNGQYPGFVFRASEGNTVTLSPSLNLALRDRVKYLEVIKNGKVVHEVRLDEYRNRKGRLPDVEFTKSGWLLIRAVTDNPNTYRFASTGPYYVDVGDEPRISRASAQFFLDWVNERVANLETALSDPRQKEEILKYHELARRFWERKVRDANAQ